MQSSFTDEHTPSLYISSIRKSRNQTKAETQRYNRQHQSLYLLKSRVSTPALKRFQKPTRKASQNSCQLKINSTLDFIGSNIVPCEILRKKVKPLFLSKNKLKQSNIQIVYKQDEKVIERRERKAKLLTQLVTNYKLNKSASKKNFKDPNFNFPTQPFELGVPKNRPSTKMRQFSLQLNEKSSTSNQKQEPKNGFLVDPEVKEIVEHQVSKIWKIQSKNSIMAKKINLLNYYERSKYESKINNIKITLKK